MKMKITTLLSGSILSRIDRYHFGAVMNTFSGKEPPMLTDERMMQMHLEAQTYLLLLIAEKIGCFHEGESK